MSNSISIVSEISFDLFIKKFKQDGINVEKYIFGDLLINLLNPDEQLLNSSNIILHFDPYFSRYGKTHIQRILESVTVFAEKVKGYVLLNNFIIQQPRTNIKNTYSSWLLPEEAINKLLSLPNVYFADFNNCVTKEGLTSAYHFKLGHLYQMPYTQQMTDSYYNELKNLIQLLNTQEKKVIVTDCDNTLWKGILGEDGIDNIKVNRNADGILFQHYQEFLLDKKNEGFLLAICSKNNEPEVKEAFEKLNMPLQWSDFVSTKINWNDKFSNLKNIADELNLGIESFILIDDSDFEIQSVKTLIPEVGCLKFEHDYNSFLNLTANFLFKRKNILDADLQKSEKYFIEKKRKEIRESTGSLEDYILELKIQTTIKINDIENIERLAQMTEKTNQFNFNKEIFSVAKLNEFIEKGNDVYSLSVTDKFGDYGIVGLMLVEHNNDEEVTLRNYLMSCRALGRGIEDTFYNFLLEDLKKKKKKLRKIIFVLTEKNKPAQLFFEKIKSE